MESYGSVIYSIYCMYYLFIICFNSVNWSYFIHRVTFINIGWCNEVHSDISSL